MTLVVWTAGQSKYIKKVVGPVIAPSGVSHRVADFKDSLPAFGAGDVVLAMGSKVVDYLKAQKLLPKNRTVGSMREHPIQVGGAKFLVTYDPGLAEKDYARLPEMQWDTQLAIRLHETGTIDPVIGNYRWVENYSELIQRVEDLWATNGNKPVDVACDLETLGLDEYHEDARIITISFTVDDGTADLMYFEKGEAPVQPIALDSDPMELPYWEALWLQIYWLLTTEKVSIRGANFKYDSRWLYKVWLILCTNNKFDTLLAGALLDENRSNSLKLHAKLHTPLGGYEAGIEDYDMGRMDLIPRPKLLTYAGGDTDATHKVARVFKSALLKDPKLANFYVNLAQPASKVFEKMERIGIHVDREYYAELDAEVRAEKARLADLMLECVPWKLRHKYKDDIVGQLEDEKSPFKPKFLKEFLFTPMGLNLKPKLWTDGGKDGTKEKQPSTAVNHLLMFDDDPVAMQFVSAFKEYNSAAKTHSTFVVGFLKHLRSDGRFHPTYMLAHADREGESGDAAEAGAVTGRTSLKDPAAQTIPKRTKWTKKLRRAFTAPPGYVILQLDFSQGELRIVAVIAEEPVMIKAYASGADLHSITAAKLSGYTMDQFNLLPEEERDSLRGRGKAGNFGLIYGMQAPGFQSYAFNSYGVKLSSEQSFEAREGFFELYSALPKWHEDAIRVAHLTGQIRSPLGRIRHLPLINSNEWSVRSLAERQAINSPIQSCLSDMMQLGMIGVDREYGHEDIHPFLMTHDSLALYVPEDRAVEWAKRIKVVLENLPLAKFGWYPSLKFPVDAEVGADLSSLKKLKNL